MNWLQNRLTQGRPVTRETYMEMIQYVKGYILALGDLYRDTGELLTEQPQGYGYQLALERVRIKIHQSMVEAEETLNALMAEETVSALITNVHIEKPK